MFTKNNVFNRNETPGRRELTSGPTASYPTATASVSQAVTVAREPLPNAATVLPPDRKSVV